MKNNQKLTKLILSLFLGSLIFTGCIGNNRFTDGAIRYQEVKIPGYEISDYENLLATENDEVKYNAICNLIKRAWDYASVLKKNDSKKPTKKEIQNAEKILDIILRELSNKNENIKAASLIFITEFSLNYSDKEKLFNKVEKVKATTLRTQYEHIRALTMLSDSKTKIDKQLIEKYLDSKSWLISSMTYLLLGKISSENLHENFIVKYNKTDKEYNKLLILDAFSNSYNPETFFFIKNEILSSDSKRIRKKAISILSKSNDKTQVAKWILNEHKTIDRLVLKDILDEYYIELELVKNTKGTIFFNELLLSEQKELIDKIDQKQFFKALYSARKKQPQVKELLNLETKVQNINSLNQAWLDFKDYMGKQELKEQEEKKREQEFENIVLPKYSLMLESFHEDTKKLFMDAGMDKDDVEVLTKEIKELLQLINKEKSK